MAINDKEKKYSNPLNRREFLKLSSGSALLLSTGLINNSLLAGSKKNHSGDNPRNILLIITDQQYMNTISAAGCPYVKTPALDQLKEQGLYFKQSHSTNPICSPARSSIFTGRMTSETGVYKNGMSIRSSIPNMGQWFTDKTNFETVYAGKWHLPHTSQRYIEGFNVLTGMIGGQGNIWDRHISRACKGFLWNRSREKPFLLVASFMQPHDICEWLRFNTDVPDDMRYPELDSELPSLPDNFYYESSEPKDVWEKRKHREGVEGNWTKQHWRYYRWSYFRHIEMVDAEIGRLLKTIEDAGYKDDTMIVFTSDHGEGLGSHQMVRKSILYEQGVKVPLIFSWPGHIPEGQNDEANLVSGIDIMPTFCDYAGIEPPENITGKSLRPIIEGNADSWRNYIVSEVSSNSGRMVRTEQYKYIVYYDDPVEQLFDLQNDPGETVNLAQNPQYDSVLTDHRNMLIEWENKLDTDQDVPKTDAWWYTENVGIDNDRNSNLPGKYKLHQNYPNPFNPSTRFKFEIAQSAKVDIKIYNLNGALVETLVNEDKQAGTHIIEWKPQKIASGNYICRMKVAGHTFSQKMMYVK